jgi:hypothetical protein
VRTVAGNRGLARCEAGWALASLGNWTFSIVLGLYAYYEQGPAGIALAVAARMLPSALLAPFASRIVELRSSRASLVSSALARFALLEAIAVLVWADGPLALVLVLAAGFELAGAVHRSARATAMFELARTPAELASASVSQTAAATGFLAGSVVAAIFLATVGLGATFAVAGVAFAAVAVLAGQLPGGASGLTRSDRVPQTGSSIRALRTVAAQPLARTLVGLFAAGSLVEATLDLLLVVAALDMLRIGDGGVGWLRAAFAAGALLGGAAAVSLLRADWLAAALGLALLLAGIPLSLVAAWPQTAVALLLIALSGVGYAVLRSSLLLLTQRLCAAEILAAAAAVQQLIYPLMRATGAGVGSWLVLQFGDSAAFIVAGLLLPTLAVIAARPVKRAVQRAQTPDRVFELFSSLPLFASLPRATIENLALCAATERFVVDEALVGAEGGNDRLCVIEDGVVERRPACEPRDRFQAGDCIGRESILGQPLGEAAFAAVTPVTALTISRTDFLRCVSAPARTAPRIAPANAVAATVTATPMREDAPHYS